MKAIPVILSILSKKNRPGPDDRTESGVRSFLNSAHSEPQHHSSRAPKFTNAASAESAESLAVRLGKMAALLVS